MADDPRRATSFSTDLATLAAFDPKVLAPRIRQPSTWWRGKASPADVDEVKQGKVALWPIGDEGTYSVRLGLAAETPLSEDEKALVRGDVKGLGLHVESGDVFVGAAERVPGDGLGDRIVALPGIGAFVRVPPGSYTALVHVLDVRSDPRFFDDEGERRPDAPPDFVVLLSPREGAFPPPAKPSPLLDALPKVEAPRSTIPPRVRTPEREIKFPRERSAPRSTAPVVEEEPPLPEPVAVGPYELGLLKRTALDVVKAFEGGPPLPGMGKGAVILRPRDRALQTKEIPVEDLLGKITRCRDQLRVFEQRVNGHEKLEDEQKLDVDLQITRCYEALDALGRAALGY